MWTATFSVGSCLYARKSAGRVTMFDYAGGLDELHMSLDFACYMLAGSSIGPCYWPADVAMTTDPPIGYIAMNDHSGPLVEDSGRAEYQVLVPIYGFTQQDDRTLYNVNVISRVLNHHLISVWTWLDLELNFSTKLARWPMGFYWQPAFTTAMSFDGATYGHLTDYTVGSYDSQSVLVHMDHLRRHLFHQKT
ncbi:hypothetical protein C8R48DRAFT_677971 [Suillus tomentosus]|nr:hypothetical protein C8R48DRAFT_677971 [Suillus tomentosus]